MPLKLYVNRVKERDATPLGKMKMKAIPSAPSCPRGLQGRRRPAREGNH
jgi:hypothetical protein